MDEAYRALHDILLKDYDVFSEHQFYSLYLDEVENMIRAANIRRVDREYEIHLAAWQNAQVQASETKGSGKNQKQVPVYATFNDFFNYEHIMKKALGEDEQNVELPTIKDDTLAELMKKARA